MSLHVVNTLGNYYMAWTQLYSSLQCHMILQKSF